MISVVVPVYNESDILGANIVRLSRAMDSLGKDYEIVIAEDGSTDGSHEAAKNLEGPGIRVLHSELRLGKGRAIANAMRSCVADIVVITDADLSSGPAQIPVLIAALEHGANIAIGSRLLPASRLHNRNPPRGMLSRAYNLLVRILFGTGVSDHQCGFKAFHRKRILEVLAETRDGGWFWDTELIVRAKRAGLKVVEVPVEWNERGSSRFILLSDVPAMALSLLWLRLRLWGS